MSRRSGWGVGGGQCHWAPKSSRFWSYREGRANHCRKMVPRQRDHNLLGRDGVLLFSWGVVLGLRRDLRFPGSLRGLCCCFRAGQADLMSQRYVARLLVAMQAHLLSPADVRLQDPFTCPVVKALEVDWHLVRTLSIASCNRSLDKRSCHEPHFGKADKWQNWKVSESESVRIFRIFRFFKYVANDA